MRQRFELLLIVIFLIWGGCQQKSEPPAQSKNQLPVARQSKEKEPTASEQLPNAWQQTSVVDIDPQRAAESGQRLGGKISELKNVIYAVEGH